MTRLQKNTTNTFIYTIEDRIPSGSLTGNYNLILTNCQSKATSSLTIWDTSTHKDRYNKSTLICVESTGSLSTVGSLAIAGNQLICVDGDIIVGSHSSLVIGGNTVILYTGTLIGTPTGTGTTVHVDTLPLSYNINTISGSYLIDPVSGYYDYSITDTNSVELEIGNILIGPDSPTTSSDTSSL